MIMLPLLLPLAAAILLLLTRRRVSLAVRRRLNLGATLLELAAVLWLLALVTGEGILVYQVGNWPAPYGISLVADRLSLWMLLITALLACCALSYAVQGTDSGSRHFHPLFQLQLFGLNGAFLTGDLFNLFVFFEVLLLASYGLLLHGGGRARVRAGLHFVVVNLAGSTLFLFAVGTLYGILGTLNMADLAVRVAETAPEDVGIVRAAGLLLFTVFALKAALLPLYLWLPAAYAHTSAPVAALFAIMTKVGAYAILRVETLIFGDAAGPLAHLIEPMLLPLALATMTVAALGVLSARGLRRQSAYLVVLSIGTLLTAFALGTPAGIAAGLYYLPHSTFAAAALFLLADVIARGRGALADRLDPGPTVPAAPVVGGVFFFLAVLISGLPPLSGFLGKWMLLQAALDRPGMAWVLALVLSASLLTIVALARSGSLLFYRADGAVRGDAAAAAVTGTGSGSGGAETLCLAEDGRAPGTVTGSRVDWPRLLPVLGLAGLCLALVLAAGLVTDFTNATAEAVLAPERYIQAVLGVDGAR
ncbi:monovalent cation/H+ antiporter subunit D [uncultured Thiohalocapsa sp.]|uniref:monovalent cation/H+ antiporter subunit D n=1 Tax=uncultured Thiohalocapsa sp. TaxID=768990 RepID=UPI00345D49EA